MSAIRSAAATAFVLAFWGVPAWLLWDYATAPSPPYCETFPTDCRPIR